jgi:hypothetical protein
MSGSPYWDAPAAGSPLLLGAAVSLMRHLSSVTWLSRDVVWVVPDARCGATTALLAWAARYHVRVCVCVCVWGGVLGCVAVVSWLVNAVCLFAQSVLAIDGAADLSLHTLAQYITQGRSSEVAGGWQHMLHVTAGVLQQAVVLQADRVNVSSAQVQHVACALPCLRSPFTYM